MTRRCITRMGRAVDVSYIWAHLTEIEMARDEQDDDQQVNEALAAMSRQVHDEPVSDTLRTLAQQLSDKLATSGDTGQPAKGQTMTDNAKFLASLEARLSAHRRLLAQLIAHLPQADRRALTDWIDTRTIMHDGQEDPGAVPVEDGAEALALADEYRLIADLAAAVDKPR
ncbi:MAG: hypothetical protein ACK4GC_01040 [Paracoccaceae bacterium]